MKWRAARRNFVVPRGMGAPRSGEESFARPLREDDRGEAGFRSDMPHRAREGRAWLRAKGIWRWQLRPDCLPDPATVDPPPCPHVKIRRPGTAKRGRCIGRSSGYRRARESSPGGSMRQQPKPFIVEIRPSRRLKPIDRKSSIWGKLDLTADPDTLTALKPEQVPAAGETNDRR